MADALVDSKQDDLSKADFFSGRNPEFLRVIAGDMETERFQANQVIITQNDVGHKAYILRTGTVEILVGQGLKQVAVLNPGSIFGEMALFGLPKRRATVRTLEGCECEAIGHGVFLKALQRFPDERKYFIALAQERKKKLDTAKINMAEEQQQQLEQLQRANEIRSRRMTAPPTMTEVVATNQDCILSAPFFAARSPAFVKLLAQCMTHEAFTEGQDIITQGDVGDNMYFLYRGRVEVLVRGMPSRLTTLESGSFFGEMALLGVPARTATIRAMEACECRSISHRDFSRIVQEFREEKQFFEELAAQRKQELEKARGGGEQPEDHQAKASSSAVRRLSLKFTRGSSEAEGEAKAIAEEATAEEKAKAPVLEQSQSVIGLCDIGKDYLKKPSKSSGALVHSNETEPTVRRSSTDSTPTDLPTVMLPPLSARVPAAILNRQSVGTSAFGKVFHDKPYQGRRRSAA